MKGREPKTIVSLLCAGAVSAAAVFATKKLFSGTTVQANDLRGKVALITGGSRGLGLALARELGSKGSRIALCARDTNELDRACRQLTDKNIEAAPFACDITEENQITPLIDRVLARFGAIDILINNAGIIKVGPLDSFEYADYDYAMKLMFWAPLNLTFAVLPHMRGRKSGHIVNITSIGGRVSVPHLVPYSCAKFALVGFSSGLSTELSSEGIHVLTVVPGLMRTGSYLNAEFTGAAKQEFAWFGILGNLPSFSVAAEYAASRIRTALERGRHTCTISLPAKLLIASEALLPEMTRNMLEFVNRALLPRGSQRRGTFTGKALNAEFGAVYQALVALGKSAALRLNE
ncbi:MAG: SDR family oxidoreductase [Acidobacteriaceae bacterium]|nr:SDR family oxidoreductase [Acidobacteriaceae bacterium]